MLRLAPRFRLLRVALVFGVTLFALGLIAVTAWSVIHDYALTQLTSEHQLRGVALLLEEHVDRSLMSTEQAVLRISDEVDDQDSLSVADEWSNHQLLNSVVMRTRELRNILIINNNGVIYASSEGFPARRLSLADREYFQFHRQSQSLAVRVGAPIQSRLDGHWLIPLSKRFNKADGSFGGVVLAALEPDYFYQFYRSLDADSATTIAIMRDDGTLLVRYPQKDSTFTQTLGRDPLFSDVHFDHGDGFVTLPATAAHERTQVSYRTLHGLPVVVMIATGERVVLARWVSESRFKASVALSVVVMLLFLVGVLRWQWRQ